MAHEKLVKEGETALRKGIKTDEIEDYFLKKGMDKKEAKEEITKLNAKRIVEEHKKNHAAAQSKPTSAKNVPSSSNPKKSSLGFWFVVLLLAAVIVYFFYVGYLSLDMFRNWNFNFK